VPVVFVALRGQLRLRWSQTCWREVLNPAVPVTSLDDWLSLTSHQTQYRSYRGRVFTGQQQCQSTKGRQVQRIRLQSHQVHPTALTIIQQLCGMKRKHTKYTQTQTNLRTVKWAQCDKTQSRELRNAHLSVLMTVHSFSIQ